MKHIAIILTTFAAALLLGGCSDSDKGFSDGGNLRVKFTADTAVGRASASDIVAPAEAGFDLKIVDSEGKDCGYWQSIADYSSDKRFDAGTYVVSASYGDAQSEGFDKPAFTAESRCSILAHQTTVVNLTATLANTAVAITRTDAFKNYFTESRVKVVTGLDSEIEFTASESRLAYVAPRDFSIVVSYVKPNGKPGSTTIPVTSVEARKFYNVRLDVNNGEVGAAKIVITFDDSTTDEDVEINIEEE